MKFKFSFPFRKIMYGMITAIILSTIIAIIGGLIWYNFWVTDVDKHELGFVFDRYTGQIEIVNHTGWVSRTPFRYSVHRIDLRPYQVSISANQRILNAKLVQFDPAGLQTFIAWHGRDAGDNLSNLQEIMKCYAFDRNDGKDCPFIHVISVLAPDQTGQPTTRP